MTRDPSMAEVQQQLLPASGAGLRSLIERLLGGLSAMWTKRASAHNLEVIEVLSLGGRRQIALIRCAEQRFLIGLGADAVNTILAVDARSDKQMSSEHS